LLDQLGHLIPVKVDVEPGSHPPVMPDIWWDEEVLRVGMHQCALRSWWRFAPDRHPPLHRMAHGEDFVADLEGGIANAALLAGFGQRQTDSAQPIQRDIILIVYTRLSSHRIPRFLHMASRRYTITTRLLSNMIYCKTSF